MSLLRIIPHIKKVSLLVISILFISSISAPAILADAGYTWTDQSSAGIRTWSGVASSSTGQYLVAVVTGGGDIWTSNDYGTNWTDISLTDTATAGQNWQSVTSDYSGKYLAAVDDGGDIWTSNDYGQNWTDQTGNTSEADSGWYFISSSSTGQYLSAVVYGGDIWTSNNYGQTWADSSSSIGTQGWYAITSSASGQYLAAVVEFGDIWTSNNYGQTWTDQTNASGNLPTGAPWFADSSSASGQDITAVDAYGDIWTSTDYGSTWIDQTMNTPEANADWWAVTESANGQDIAAGVWFGDIYTSIDGGATWTDNTSAGSHGWYAMASSTDGSRVIAADGDGFGRFSETPGGDLWTSYDPSLYVPPATPPTTTSGTTATTPSAPSTGFGVYSSNNSTAPIVYLAATGLLTIAFGLRRLTNTTRKKVNTIWNM